MRTTRLGKVVGSIKTDPSGWCYYMRDGKWAVIAPSGAWMYTAKDEAEAREIVECENREWFAL